TGTRRPGRGRTAGRRWPRARRPSRSTLQHRNRSRWAFPSLVRARSGSTGVISAPADAVIGPVHPAPCRRPYRGRNGARPRGPAFARTGAEREERAMPSFTAPDGTELAYRAEGEGEPLICLPGGPMRAGAYLGGLGGLARRRRLVVPDPRGTGGSGPCADPAGYRCDRQAGDVEALRAHLGLDRIDLLAHSAAGDLAVLYAARHPERVRSLVLVTARGRALGVDFTEEQRREAAALRAAEPWYPQARDALDAVLAGTATDAQRDAAGPLFYGRWDCAAQTHATPAAGQTNEEAARAYAAPGAFDPPAARAAVAGLHAPVLAVAGELDGGPLPRVAAEIAGLFPRGETAVLPGAGHYPWLDAPEDFARTVGDFLDREAAAAAGADFPPALAELAAAWTPGGGVDFEKS